MGGKEKERLIGVPFWASYEKNMCFVGFYVMICPENWIISESIPESCIFLRRLTNVVKHNMPKAKTMLNEKGALRIH